MDLFMLFFVQITVIFLLIWLFRKKDFDFCLFVEKINEKLFVGILVLLTIALPFLYISRGHNWGGDFSCYIAQAQSILSGTMKEQVEANTYLMSNSDFMHGPGSYPWGFPLLLAPIIMIFGVNYIALKCVNVLFLMLSMLILYKLLKVKLSLAYARVGALFFATNSVLLGFCNDVLSDIPFLFFSLLSVYFIDRLFISQEKQFFYGAMTGLSCFFAYFVRSNGIVSILTVVAIDFMLLILNLGPLKKLRQKIEYPRQKPLAHVVAYAVFGCGMVLDKLIFPVGGTGYGYYFGFFSKDTLVDNFMKYFTGSFNFFTTDLGNALPVIFPLALLLVYAVKKELHREMVSFVYIAGMFALVVIFPAYQGIRYLFPILPLMLMLGLKALLDFEKNHVKGKKFKSVFRLAVGVFICVVIVSVAYNTTLHARRVLLYDVQQEKNTSYTADAIEVYDYIKENTDEEDIISFYKPRVLWLNTQRKGFSISSINIDRAEEVDYVLFSLSSVNPALMEYCENSESAEIAFTNDEFVLYSMGNK